MRGAFHAVIIGGGFCGTMALANLVHLAEAPLTLTLIEQRSRLAAGVAYSTQEPRHLLNVPAGRMGAFADAPQGFFEWLGSRRLQSDEAAMAESFISRALYSDYLAHVLEESLALAKIKGMRVQLVQGRAVDADIAGDTVRLHVERLEGEQTLHADAVVLATGNLAPRDICATEWQGEHPRYIRNPWGVPPGSPLWADIASLPPESDIWILGTGLTMMDMVLSLRAHGYAGNITAVSRHGLLPACHVLGQPHKGWALVDDPASAPRTALGLLHAVRSEVRRAKAQDVGWRAVVDALRPVTQRLWRQLPEAEKKRFVRRILPFWNTHRHRMAPEIHAVLQQESQSGRLRVFAAALESLGARQEGVTVRYRSGKPKARGEAHASYVLNCTPPAFDIAQDGDAFLKNLCGKGIVVPHNLRMGVQVCANGSAEGCGEGLLFPLGALLVGELLESTAVPELRVQARLAAERVLERRAKTQAARGKLNGTRSG